MRGIYLNCEVPAEVHDIGAPEPDGCKLTFECGDNTLHLVGCNDIYFVEKDGYQMFLSGWAYTNRSIRPRELFRFFQNNGLNEIATGNLIAVVYNQETEKQDKAQERLFKAMYPELSAEDRSQLLAEFQCYTSHLQLSETQKLSYFDALYGKTARSAQLTEQVLPNQFYRSVPVIAHRQIFSLLLQEDLSKATRKQVLERLLL